jgi:hypothetical protein
MGEAPTGVPQKTDCYSFTYNGWTYNTTLNKSKYRFQTNFTERQKRPLISLNNGYYGDMTFQISIKSHVHYPNSDYTDVYEAKIKGKLFANYKTENTEIGNRYYSYVSDDDFEPSHSFTIPQGGQSLIEDRFGGFIFSFDPSGGTYRKFTIDILNTKNEPCYICTDLSLSCPSDDYNNIYIQTQFYDVSTAIVIELASTIQPSMVLNIPFNTSYIPTNWADGNSYEISYDYQYPVMFNDSKRGYVMTVDSHQCLKAQDFNIPQSYTKSIWIYSTGSQEMGHLISSKTDYYMFSGVHNFSVTDNQIKAGHSVSGGDNTALICNNLLSLNKWIHLCLTYDNTSTTMNLYKNGIKISSVNSPYLNWSGGNSGVSINNYKGISGSGFNGRIDNVKIFNRALDASEVLSLCTYEKENSQL